jgi:phosphoserine phosphatase RsbX
MTRLRLFHADLAPGDRLVLFSDGISSRFDEEVGRSAPALATCRAIMERHRRPHDDATVLVTDIEDQNARGDLFPPGLAPSERAP